MNEELKPCPFCGGQELCEDTYSGSPTIMCQTPGCGALIGGEESEAAAGEVREAWNRRVTPPAAQVQGEQPEVVAWKFDDITEDDLLRTKPFLLFARPDGACPGPEKLPDYQTREPLMTVAQHQRIVAALEGERAEQWRLRRDFEARCDTQDAVIAELRAALSAPPAAGVPEGISIERDMMGTMHVKVGEFDYVQVRYQHPYTDNASTRQLAERIAALIAAPTPPASEQQQAVVLPERREHPSMSMYAGFKEYATAYGEVSGHNDCLDQIERLNPHLAGVNQGVTTEAGNGGDA